MVMPLLQSIEESRLKAGEKETEVRKRELSLSAQNIDFQSLNDFLLRYAPLQLIGDRGSSRRLAIGRRVINACFHMNSVNTLVTASSAQNTKLADLIVVDGRAALPHPLWSADHDATLLRAIAKHGWIDRDKSVKAIVDDRDIKWGHPFEAIEVAPKQEPSEQELSRLRATAQRAKKFMEDNREMIEQMKGCSRHIISDSYGLVHGSNDGDGSNDGGEDPDNITWVVDDEKLMKASTAVDDEPGTQDLSDLPSKKDLVKRAKVLLSKSLAALESGRAVGNILAAKSGEKGKENDYSVIDQGDRCCILLADMVRGIVKGSPKSSPRNLRMLCALAYEESMALKALFPTNSEKANEMQKIADQIALGKVCFKAASIPAKNVFRVMLGMDPVPTPKGDMFPSKALLNDDPAKQKPQAKREPASRRDDGTLAEKALNRAMKKAFDKAGDTPCRFTKADDPQVGVQLTMIECLILYILCTDGMPLSKNTLQGDTNLQPWEAMGTVLEIAAKDYFQTSKEKVAKARLALKKLESHEESAAKTQAAAKVAVAEFDEVAKEEAAQQAVDYATFPDKLAKKRYVLLMPSVRVPILIGLVSFSFLFVSQKYYAA